MLILQWAVCAGLLSGLAITPKLWQAARLFPTVPAAPFLPRLPQVLTAGLAALLVCALLAAASLPWRRWPVYSALGAALLLIAFDINRLQPWVFLYLLLLSGLTSYDWKSPDSSCADAAWSIVAAVLVCVYVWSGIQKLNVSFFDYAQHQIEALRGWGSGELASRLAALIPIAEIAVGLLLFFPKTRTGGVIAAIAMHAVLLALLSPFGLGYNSAVWPWNFWMAVIVGAIFLKSKTPIPRLVWRSPFGKMVVLVVGVLPALNFSNLWDDNLSWALYTVRNQDGVLVMDLSQTPELERLQGPEGGIGIHVWAIEELNVPAYPEARVFQAIAAECRRRFNPPGEIRLEIYSRRSQISGNRTRWGSAY